MVLAAPAVVITTEYVSTYPHTHGAFFVYTGTDAPSSSRTLAGKGTGQGSGHINRRGGQRVTVTAEDALALDCRLGRHQDRQAGNPTGYKSPGNEKTCAPYGIPYGSDLLLCQSDVCLRVALVAVREGGMAQSRNQVCGGWAKLAQGTCLHGEHDI